MRTPALIALCGVWVGGGLAGCLPNPQSVKERRETFNRKPLKSDGLILDSSPADMIAVGAEFGKKVKLVGYTMEPSSPSPGDRVAIKFYWTAIAPIAEDYEIFIHGDAIGGNASRI